MLLQNLDAQVLADRHVAAVLMAAGAKDIDLPNLQEQRDRFEAALLEEPRPMAPVDREQMELRRALGVS